MSALGRQLEPQVARPLGAVVVGPKDHRFTGIQLLRRQRLGGGAAADEGEGGELDRLGAGVVELEPVIGLALLVDQGAVVVGHQLVDAQVGGPGGGGRAAAGGQEQTGQGETAHGRQWG